MIYSGSGCAGQGNREFTIGELKVGGKFKLYFKAREVRVCEELKGAQ